MQSWSISLRIWGTAVIANTLIGTACLTGFTDPFALGLLFFGLFASALFSLPILLILWPVLDKCQSSGIKGPGTLCLIYGIGIACTVLVHACFMFYVLGEFSFFSNIGILGLNLLAAVLGITVQAHRILKISAVEPE